MMPVISRRQRDLRCYKRIVTVESLSELLATPVPTSLHRSRLRLTLTANALSEPLISSQSVLAQSQFSQFDGMISTASIKHGRSSVRQFEVRFRVQALAWCFPHANLKSKLKLEL